MARTKHSNPELAIEIGKIIRAQRKAAGMTQAMLAETVGLESETVSRMENGIRLPSIEKLVEMADVFCVPVAVFFRTCQRIEKTTGPSSARGKDQYGAGKAA